MNSIKTTTIEKSIAFVFDMLCENVENYLDERFIHCTPFNDPKFVEYTQTVFSENFEILFYYFYNIKDDMPKMLNMFQNISSTYIDGVKRYIHELELLYIMLTYEDNEKELQTTEFNNMKQHKLAYASLFDHFIGVMYGIHKIESTKNYDIELLKRYDETYKLYKDDEMIVKICKFMKEKCLLNK